jgi:VWFA-related protein
MRQGDIAGLPRCLSSLLSVVLTILACLASSPSASAQTNNQTAASPTQSQSAFQLKAQSNLVVVRVVVRDPQGKPVEGLRKEDFKLFDRGKEQSISQFEVETAAALPPSTAVHAPGQASSQPATPGKFLALYFDDLNTSDADMMQARDAADHYLASKLDPKDRVAIFTSGAMLTDFTSDPKQIHDALFKLHASPRALSRVTQCPNLSDYQASQIDQFGDDQSIDAWQVALDEVAHRCPSPHPDDLIRMLARDVVGQAEIQSRTSLTRLQQIVQILSPMPGQRIIVMVSPGFLSESEQYQLDRTIDRALHAQVVISSLDPRGLALLMRETDVTLGYSPAANSGVIAAMHNVDSGRELVATDVLAEVAQGTGGEFFHNNNDLKAGFSALAGSPVYYILAFAPTDVKPDGRFHALKVTLTEKEKGVTIKARKGYFAPRNEADAEAQASQRAVSDADMQAQEQIRQAIISKADAQPFPVALAARLAEGQGETRELSLFAHLDPTPLHFHKEGDRNLNNVTFVFAIFDPDGNLVMSQQRHARVSVLDEQLPDFLKTGVDVSMSFQLKPGVYRIREVVAESEDHHITTFSKAVKIP